MAAGETSGIKLTTGYEAWYGDKNGSLALLKYPARLHNFFLRLSDRADLPDSPPAGIAWEPFIRGWQQDNYYVVTLTRPDHNSPRPGMVATRMIAVPLEDSKDLTTLAEIFEYLRDVSRLFSEEHAFDLNPEIHYPVSEAVLTCVSHHLISQAKPVAVLGQANFDAVVCSLWRKLPSKLRQTFTFGFSFTPNDLVVSRTNVVAVPESCILRWNEYTARCGVNWNVDLAVETAALLHEPSAAGYLSFLDKIGVTLNSFTEYGRYARLWDEWQRRGDKNPQICFGLLRSIGTLLPNPAQASEQKLEALQVAAEALKSASPEEILAQRSVKASSFPDNAAGLARAVIDWIKNAFSNAESELAADFERVIAAIPTSQSEAWQTWVREGLKAVLNPLSEVAATRLWRLVVHSDVFMQISMSLPQDTVAEDTLIRTLPEALPPATYEFLEKWGVERSWLNFSTKVAFTHSGFSYALQFLMRQKPDASRKAAVKLLCSLGTTSEIWQSAFQFDDVMLAECAADAGLRNPELWIQSTSDLNIWTSLLDKAAALKPDFMLTIQKNDVIVRLFQAWERGTLPTSAILRALRTVNRLDFSNYPDRQNLWRVIPSEFLDDACKNTLREILRNYYANPTTKLSLEPELRQILFDRANLQITFPENLPTLGSGGLSLLQLWGNDAACQAWLQSLIAGKVCLAADVAESAGKLVCDHNWSSAARLAKYYAEDCGRSDLTAVWRTYYESLGRLEKMLFDFQSYVYSPTIQDRKSRRGKADAVFVTALPEEFSAVRAHLSNRREQVEQGTIYELGVFEVDGRYYSVAVVQTGMGNAPSAAATERGLSLFKPAFALFVGIAGGLRDDLSIGDVIVADKVYGYEVGKAGKEFQPRPEATTVSHEALQRAYAVVRENSWLKRIIPSSMTPNAMVKPIAAGEKVLVSELAEDLRRLRATYTDAHAVAMEEHGFSVAVRTHPDVCFAVVRGISDLIENKSHADKAGSHDIAARNAAAFAFEMLAGLLRARSHSRKQEDFIGWI